MDIPANPIPTSCDNVVGVTWPSAATSGSGTTSGGGVGMGRLSLVGALVSELRWALRPLCTDRGRGFDDFEDGELEIGTVARSKSTEHS